ncbi:MAG: ribonuclease III [Oscillospiraceae bacterium]|nr:ribonuclease III [Oscillospiraceae bacterium]
MSAVQELEQKLQYTFRDPSLLEQALCHSSFANEHRSRHIQSNERLEFLGDSILGVVTAEFLYRQRPDWPEGELTRSRAALVCEKSLYGIALEIGLGEHLRLGRGEETGGGRTRPSILADAVEAVLAAVYLDGGMEAASALIYRCLLSGFREEVPETRNQDYKTVLQELIQHNPEHVMTYGLLDEQGPDHAKVFTMEVRVNGRQLGRGTGRSKKEAEQAAAKAALELLSQTEQNHG